MNRASKPPDAALRAKPEAVAEVLATHAKSTSGYRDQLAVVAKKLKDNSAAVDRYLNAFEKGTLDDDDQDVQARLAELKSQSRQLRASKTKLEIELEQPLVAPAPADLSKIRTRIREILTHGTHNAKKAPSRL